MYLNKLSISEFKNISGATLDFSPNLNCITGINGSGKTNVLDAVYYLSMTKSYFSNPDSQSIAYSARQCHVSGEYTRFDASKDIISFSIERNGSKVFKRNSKNYSKLSDHIGVIPIVMVSPYDTCLVNESGEERRRFLNSILSQLDAEYLRRLQNYNQLLQQRNRLLKLENINEDLLDTFTSRLSVNASYIYDKREEFTLLLTPIVKKYYNLISGKREEISIEYVSELRESSLEQLLAINREKEKILKFTSAGIQRDDLLFSMNGHKFRLCGSQGQQKTFLISLKLAQFEIMREMYKKQPILLLDDVFDKLDMTRVEALLGLVSSDIFGQIFITDSNKVRVKEILVTIGGDSALFELNGGDLR